MARRLLNNNLTNEDKNPDYDKRQAFSVLKKTETHSGVRHGLGGTVGKKPQRNNNNNDQGSSSVKVFEVKMFCDNCNMVELLLIIYNLG